MSPASLVPERLVRQPAALRVPPSASPAELRLAFKLRELELRAEGAAQAAFSAAERAFNILAHPELRSCYEALLSEPCSAPVLFPYGGFGSIAVLGDRSRDGSTLFVRRIVSFLPERRQRRFRAPLRKFEFYRDRALYRDPRRKLEVLVDQSAMPIVWDPTWNQWKHFLATKVEIQGTFVEAGKYHHRGEEWQLRKWETALPSRLQVKLPADTAEEVETARGGSRRPSVGRRNGVSVDERHVQTSGMAACEHRLVQVRKPGRESRSQFLHNQQPGCAPVVGGVHHELCAFPSVTAPRCSQRIAAASVSRRLETAQGKDSGCRPNRTKGPRTPRGGWSVAPPRKRA